jgi:probable rRNA maturation factor
MIEINNKTKNKIDLKLVEGVAAKFLKKYKKTKHEVSIAFIGDAEMKKLNKIYRGIDKPTDVLAFPGEEKGFLGEIVIDYAQIKRQAKLYSGSVREELVFILVHGLLHLLGYDDETEKGREAMAKMGKKFIKDNNF